MEYEKHSAITFSWAISVGAGDIAPLGELSTCICRSGGHGELSTCSCRSEGQGVLSTCISRSGGQGVLCTCICRIRGTGWDRVSSLPVFHCDFFEHVKHDVQVRYVLRSPLPVGVAFSAPQSESYNVHIHYIVPNKTTTYTFITLYQTKSQRTDSWHCIKQNHNVLIQFIKHCSVPWFRTETENYNVHIHNIVLRAAELWRKHWLRTEAENYNAHTNSIVLTKLHRFRTISDNSVPYPRSLESKIKENFRFHIPSFAADAINIVNVTSPTNGRGYYGRQENITVFLANSTNLHSDWRQPC